MSTFTDQTGKEITLKSPPERIISLVPSQTEFLYDLGLEDEVIGITKFCTNPEVWFRTKKRIGGTKDLKINTIKSLGPDLIIANKEENIKQQVEELESFCPVWTSDVSNTEDAFDMMLSLGEILCRKERAQEIVSHIRFSFQKLSGNGIHGNPQFGFLRPARSKFKTAYLIWKDPYMTAGGDTFINDMMELCGFQNLYAGHKRYPITTPQELREAGCNLLLLSSEPFPFKAKHVDELQHQLPFTKIILVNGEMFSWYGSRMQYAPLYFRNLLQDIAHNPLEAAAI